MRLYFKINPRYRLPLVAGAVLLAALINAALSLICQNNSIPFFMDSIFTIFTAALFGLIPGVLTGILTNIFFLLFSGTPGFWFAIVSTLTALFTYKAVKKKMLDTAAGILWTIIILALINSAAGTFVVTLFYGGVTGQAIDSIVRAIVVTGRSIWTSAFLGRILINLVDKGIGILLLLPVYRYLERSSSTVYQDNIINRS